MSQVLHIKNHNTSRTVKYEENLRHVLDWEKEDTKVLKKSAGLLKKTLKKNPVSYQRQLRREWERSKRNRV